MAKKRCWKLLPCDFYDIEKLESWLQDMAAQGWHQRKNKLVGKFEAGEPKHVRYRVQPKAKWYDDRTPDSDMKALFRHMGWEFVTSHAEFYIFSSEDGNAPELNTEPKLMANGFRSLLWGWGLCAVLYSLLLGRNLWSLVTEFCRYLANFGAFYTLGFGVLLLTAMGTMIFRWVQVFRCYLRLKQAEGLDHNKPWRPGARAFRVGAVGMAVVCTFAALVILVTPFTQWKQDITEYPGDPKIVTLADLYPNGDYQRSDWLDYYNKFRLLDHSMAHMLHWTESAEVTTPEGRTVSGLLIVEYYEVSSAWVAEGLTRELEREIRKNEQYEPVELPEFGLDYVSGYDRGSTKLVLRQGNVVMKVTVSRELAVLWLELTAERLQ